MPGIGATMRLAGVGLSQLARRTDRSNGAASARAAWPDRDRGRSTRPRPVSLRVAEGHVDRPPSRATNVSGSSRLAEFHRQARRGRSRSRRRCRSVAAAEAQAAAAAARQRPAIAPVPGRASWHRRPALLALLAQQHGGAGRRRGRAAQRPAAAVSAASSRSMKPVSISPLRTCGWLTSASRNVEIGGHARRSRKPSAPGHAVERLGAIGAPGDQLRQQRVVVGRDRVAGAEAGVDANAVARRRLAPARRCVPIDGRKPLSASSA